MKAGLSVWEMVKEAVIALGGKTTSKDIKVYIKKKYGDINEGTINCQILACSVNSKSRIHWPENKKPRIANGHYDFLYTLGNGKVALYDPQIHGVWEIRKDGNGVLMVCKVEEGLKEFPETDVVMSSSASLRESLGNDTCEMMFPLESHLRDFIVQNLSSIKIHNKSLMLYVNENGVDGVEYRTDVGIIDILAIDDENNFVIFELKLSRGNDQTLGQLLRYMGWVEENIAHDKKVHGVIVAKTIDEKLRYAMKKTQDVILYEYEIDFKITPINVNGRATISPVVS